MQSDALSAAAPGRYAAFISYSHRDRKCAEWVHRAIETYRVPRGFGDVAGRLKPVFIDRAELPSSSDLAASVREALTEARFLIVICSPAAASSRWVNEEVRTFKALGRADRILCVIAEGEPPECFPPALRFQVHDEFVTNLPASEPLAADLRPEKDGKRSVRLKLVAGLLQVPLDRLRQREHARRARRMAVIAAASGVGCVLLSGLLAVAILARNEADRQRAIAEQQSLTARRTSEFLKSLFKVSDPSEARGNSITAREVLDRGAQQIAAQLHNEPQVRADLATTLGEVYSGLGLLQQARKLLEEARSVPGQSESLTAQQDVALGELEQLRGDYDVALTFLQRALPILERSPSPDPALEVRVLSALGDVYQGKDDYETSRKYFQKVLEVSRRVPSAGQATIARALEGVAQADLEAGAVEEAEHGFQRALAAQLAATGQMHPRTSEILNELGSLEYTRKRFDAAIGYFQQALAIDRRVLGEGHPDVGITLNNLARVLLERRHFAEARRLLVESLALRSSKVVETSDHLAFAMSNLALVDVELGDYTSANDLFKKALTAAIANKHRLHGPILTDLADLECRQGHYAEALERLDEARPLIIERYPDVPWRAAHVDNVRAGCLVGLGRFEEAAPLFASSTPIVLEAWPADSVFGHDALERQARFRKLAAARLSVTRQ